MVHVACAVCSGTLPECPELHWDTLKVYPQTDRWTDDIIRQLDLIQTTAPVSTRRSSKTQTKNIVLCKGKLVERKIHNLLRRFISQYSEEGLGSVYTLYNPKFDIPLLTTEKFNSLFKVKNISFQKLLRLVSFGLIYHIRGQSNKV